jgi:hypothetical protein
MPKSKTDVTVDQPGPSDDRTATADSPDRLDWDACLETPPPRRSGTIKVRLNFLGRGKPLPLADPDDSGNDTPREAP